MNLVDIYFKMKKDVQYIEDELEKSIDTDVRELYQSSTHLLKAGESASVRCLCCSAASGAITM